jgi:hypothetical protein
MSLPLPWTRAYGLVLTSANDSSAAGVTPAFKETLARDAVRIDARAATAVAAGCPVATLAPNRSAHPETRIAYRAGDRTAGDLAARLAALGIAGARSVVALDSVALIASLRAGAEVAYVVVLARACDEASRAAGAAVLPLVETRAHAVVRSGAPPLTVDRDGVLRLLPETP